MTGIFDGMAGVLSDVFGAPAMVQPPLGVAVEVRGIFRADPIEVARTDGHVVLITAPTFRVRRDVLPDIARGYLVTPSVTAAEGKTFKVLNKLPNGSPASDAFLVCELEEVLP